MERRLAVVAMVLLSAGWSACLPADELFGEAQQAVGNAPPHSNAGGKGKDAQPLETCSVTKCVTVTMPQAISFVAVDLGLCAGATASVKLYLPDMTPVNVTPVPHVDGKSCGGVAATALKFEGLPVESESYVVCVTYDGVSDIGD